MMIRDNMNLWSKLPDKLDLKPSLTLVLFPEWLICYHIKTTKINEKLVSCPSFLLYCVSEWAGSAPCSTNAITALPSLSSQCTASAWATEGGNSSVCIWLLHTYTFSLPLLFSQETKEICALWSDSGGQNRGNDFGEGKGFTETESKGWLVTSCYPTIANLLRDPKA